MNGLSKFSFALLRAANICRIPLFRNALGEPAHSEPDGSDWSKGEWCNAVLGELGELANLLKKVQRGDMTMDEARQKIAKELADTVTYLDILAFQCGVDLGRATLEKFNEVSERVGCNVFVTEPLPVVWFRPIARIVEDGAKVEAGIEFRLADKDNPEIPPPGEWLPLYQ